jgi:hypothetical protein
LSEAVDDIMNMKALCVPQDITLCEEFNEEVRQQATKVREMVADIVIPLARNLGTPHVEHLARTISNLSATPSLGDGAKTSDLEARREAANRQRVAPDAQ